MNAKKAVCALAMALGLALALGAGVNAQSGVTWPDALLLQQEAGTNAVGFVAALDKTIVEQIAEARDQQAFADALWLNLFPKTGAIDDANATDLTRVVDYFDKLGRSTTITKNPDGTVSLTIAAEPAEEVKEAPQR